MFVRSEIYKLILQYPNHLILKLKKLTNNQYFPAVFFYIFLGVLLLGELFRPHLFKLYDQVEKRYCFLLDRVSGSE